MFDDSREDGLLQGLGVDDRPHAGPHVGDAQSRQLAQPAHLVLRKKCEKDVTTSRVADPDPNPDPLDPRVFGSSGSRSGSISQRYGSGSGSRSRSLSKNNKKNLDFYCFVPFF